MDVSTAQEQLRAIYRSGSVGSLVAGVLWLASGSAALAGGMGWGIGIMVAAGFFIYPLTQLVLLSLRGPSSVPRDNPLRELSVEVPLVGPAMLPLVAAAALYRVEWFYPAMMLAIGAHYVPFSFLYGMRAFIGLGVAMVAGGLVVGLWAPNLHLVAAFGTAGLMLAFAALAHLRNRREQPRYRVGDATGAEV